LATIGLSAQSDFPKVELSAGYSYVNINPQIITSQNFNGGGGSFVYNFTPVLGIKADFMGYGGGTGWTNYLKQHGYDIAGSASGNAFTYLFGPQFKKHSGKYQPFGEALFGSFHSNGYATVIQCLQTGSCSSKSGNGNNNGFAMEFGGGLDLALSQHVQIRPVEVDYLYTHFNANHIAHYSAGLNNFKYFGGLNFTLGGK
jgi:hypothetical protein